MDKIAFSVVIPLYNKEKSIKSTVQSVLSQSYPDFEIVVVNDGSKDNSLKVLRSVSDIRLRIIDKPNGGVSSARNRGIREAKNKWIALLDGDDLWMPDHLFTLVKMIKSYPEEAMYYTKYCLSGQTVTEEKVMKIAKTSDYLCEVLSGNNVSSSTVCLNKDVLFQKGIFFDEMLTHGEDLDLWYRISRKYDVVFTNKITVVYQVDTENRACNTLPKDLSTHYIYTMRFSDYKNMRCGVQYYNHILRAFLQVCMYKRDYKSFFKIAGKQGYVKCIYLIFSTLRMRLNRRIKR